jgi:8-amino-3,8-dideoxy-alpha-D-manno-octulosonate transaminase
MPGFELVGQEERDALNALFDEGGILFAHGFDAMRKKYHVREFEQAVATKLGAAHGLAVTSGTSALKIGLKALGVQPGDEVITQAFNFIAAVEAILDVGAVPVIANVDETLNMDPRELEELITSKTKVILPVHMLGVPADMNEIMRLAKAHDLKVLEDACEALGARYGDKHLGAIGDAAALSFDFGKVITCGEGGMLLTNQADVDKYAREYHDHGHENNPNLPRGRDSKATPGFNYRITEMQGAVGNAQLKKLDTILDMNKQRYDALLLNLGDSLQMRAIPDGSVPIHDSFIFFVDVPDVREKIVTFLGQEGFGTKNLPDAVEWHCAAYWDHALSQQQIEHVEKTKKLLATAIAIPIALKKTVGAYAELGAELRKLLDA